jgi:hypothetical protein
MNEKFKDLLESTKYAPLNGSDRNAMGLLLENAQRDLDQLINEGTLAGDVAQFTPILMPMVRRVYPTLIANELLGIQPMTMPTGFIYALTNQYIGTNNNNANPNSAAVVVELSGATTKVEGDTVFTNGKVLYVEGKKVLIAGGTGVIVGAAIEVGVTITGIFTNEASFKRIFKNYTGSYTTAAGEALGKDMKEIGFSISKKSVEAKVRALKGRYSVEMYQDLKAQHGLLADEEIMSLMSYEIQAEIDREVVDFVNANSTILADTSFTADSTDGTGRWEIEKYRREVIRISKEAAQIGIDTKRGQGNTLLVSPKVATMLEQVGKFKVAEQLSNVSAPVSGGVAGIFDGRFKVLIDQYATSDYCTVLYKGADRRDAMGFFAPYVPLSFQKVTNTDSGQPAIIAKTRYALDTIPGVESATSNDRAKTYSRSFGINFTNTVLA